MADNPISSRVHEHLDGIRGSFVLTAIFGHTFLMAVSTKGVRPWYNWWGLWFQPSQYLVGLFVIISGYCLMLPVVHGNKKTVFGGFWGYMRRRGRRIVPPYYVACLLCLLHTYLFPSLYLRIGMKDNPWRPGILISHLFFFFNLTKPWRFGINGSYWSLAPEWQLYILFPLLLVPFWKRFGRGGLLAGATLGTIILLLPGDAVRDLHPWYLLLFVCGMVGADVASSTDHAFAARRDRVPWGGISLALVAAFMILWVALLVFDRPIFFRTIPEWKQYCANEMLLGLALVSAFLHWNRVQAKVPRDEWPWVLHFLNQRWLKWIGSFSYSLYLVHWPILVTVASLVRALHWSEAPTLLLSWAIAMPSVIVIGYLFFLALERRLLPTYARKAEVPLSYPLQTHSLT